MVALEKIGAVAVAKTGTAAVAKTGSFATVNHKNTEGDVRRL